MGLIKEYTIDIIECNFDIRSTLLKMLSRVIILTEGSRKINVCISSILETVLYI